MLERMRYVTRRISRSGKERWYWQRTGHPLTRLPDDPTERYTEQLRLNATADGTPLGDGPVHGSIAWVIATYKASDRYKDLRPGTVKYYKRYLADIGELAPDAPFSGFNKKKTVDFIASYDLPHQRRQAAAVLKNLVDVALYHELITEDPTLRLRLKTIKPRDRVWSPDEVDAWMQAAAKEDPHMLTAFMLLQFTAQRPGDVLAMTWGQYNGRTIKLRQQKTLAQVEVPCHPELKAHLDGLKRANLMIVSYRGRGVPYLRFNERFRRVCERAGVDAQARDLRRTAMVRMAEGGAEVKWIATVSGHSIDSTTRILETYLPGTLRMAEAAIARFEHKPRSKV